MRLTLKRTLPSYLQVSCSTLPGLSRLSRLCSPPVPGTECPVSPENEGGRDSLVRAGEGSNLGLARAAVLLRVTRGVYFARTVPNQAATDALATWAGPPKTTQPLPGVQMATACPTRGTPSASVATCGGVESPDVHKCNRGSSPLPAFVEDLSLRRPRLGLVAMQLRGHGERKRPRQNAAAAAKLMATGRQLVDKTKFR